jgi:hypothetical protein
MQDVEAKPFIVCRCKIVRNRIIFSAYTKSAGRLLATCDHLKIAEPKDDNMIREMILRQSPDCFPGEYLTNVHGVRVAPLMLFHEPTPTQGGNHISSTVH